MTNYEFIWIVSVMETMLRGMSTMLIGKMFHWAWVDHCRFSWLFSAVGTNTQQSLSYQQKHRDLCHWSQCFWCSPHAHHAPIESRVMRIYFWGRKTLMFYHLPQWKRAIHLGGTIYYSSLCLGCTMIGFLKLVSTSNYLLLYSSMPSPLISYKTNFSFYEEIRVFLGSLTVIFSAILW